MRCIGEGCPICGGPSKDFKPLTTDILKRLEKATDEQKKKMLFDVNCPVALRHWAFDALYPELSGGNKHGDTSD